MRKFGDDGPTRSELGNKIQYEGFLSPLALRRFGEYMRRHQVQEDGNLRESDNWQKGIPLESYMDSLLRHILDVWGIHRKWWETSEDGDEMEDLLCAVLFNVQGYLHEIVKKRKGIVPFRRLVENTTNYTIPAGTAWEQEVPIKYHCSQCVHHVPAGMVCLKAKLLLTPNPEVGNCPFFEQ